MKVVLQSKKMVKPKTLTPPHLRRHGLSLFDHNQPPVYIPIAIFYRGDDSANFNEELNSLEDSLSEALAIHYPLAGHYVDDGSSSYVDCNDQGVEFIVGTVDCRLDQVLEMNPECPGYHFINLITRTLNQAENLSPIVVRVHVFECGAINICLTFFHKVVDLSSAIEFLKAWATISCGGIIDESRRPCFVVPSIFPPIERSPLRASPSSISISHSEKLVMKRFGFDGVTLAKMASAIGGVSNVSETNTENRRPPSNVEIVLGLVLKALVKIDGWKSNGDLRPLAFLTAMNLRGKSGTLTPKNTFGNLCIDAYGEASNEDGEMELSGFVRIVQETINNTRCKYAGIDNVEEFRAIVEEDSRNIGRIRANGKDKHVVLSTSWCGFGLYEVDFGFGKPEIVLNPGPPFKMVILMDGRIDNGGIDAFVILDEMELSHFNMEIMDDIR